MFLFVDTDRMLVYPGFFDLFIEECDLFCEAIKVFMKVQNKNEEAVTLDPHVGDCACQVRATILNNILFKISNSRLEEMISLVSERQEKVKLLKEKYHSTVLPFSLPIFKKNCRFSVMDRIHKLSLFYSNATSYELFVMYYAVVSYTLQKFKDEDGLALLKTNSKLETYFKQLQLDIADLSVNFLLSLASQYESLTGISSGYLRTLMFRDKGGRIVMPLFLTFHIQWIDWKSKNIPIIFKIVRYYKSNSNPFKICDISINYLIIHNQKITTDPELLKETNETAIIIESSSFDGSFEQLNEQRRGKTCLSVDKKNFTIINDEIFKEKLSKLTISQVENIVRATVADHPQLVSEVNTLTMEHQMMEKLNQKDRSQLLDNAKMAVSLGCCRKSSISMFANIFTQN